MQKTIEQRITDLENHLQNNQNKWHPRDISFIKGQISTLHWINALINNKINEPVDVEVEPITTCSCTTCTC